MLRGATKSNNPGALSILKGAVPGLAPGLGHTAPTYAVGSRDRALWRPSRLRTSHFFPSPFFAASVPPPAPTPAVAPAPEKNAVPAEGPGTPRAASHRSYEGRFGRAGCGIVQGHQRHDLRKRIWLWKSGFPLLDHALLCAKTKCSPVSDAILSDDLTLLRKAETRASALAQRDGMPAADRLRAADAIAARALPFAVRPGVVVSGFMPIRSEISPLPLMRRLASMGARLALPAIAGRGQPLALRAWAFGEPLVRGQWGIREPAATADTLLPDILIVPLAAFDRRGGRIGYGAGYYDMTLAQARAARSVLAIGIAFAKQEVESVPMADHDQRLDLVLTEHETIPCRVF